MQHKGIYRFDAKDGDILIRRDDEQGNYHSILLLTNAEIVNSYEVNELLRRANDDVDDAIIRDAALEKVERENIKLLEIIKEWLLADGSDSNIAREKVRARMKKVAYTKKETKEQKDDCLSSEINNALSEISRAYDVMHKAARILNEVINKIRGV